MAFTGMPTTDEVSGALTRAICKVKALPAVDQEMLLSELSLDSLDILEVITILEDEFAFDIPGMEVVSRAAEMRVRDLADVFLREAAKARG